MESIIQLLEQIKFGPSYGDWSGAIVAIFFGAISFLSTITFAIFGYFKWKTEVRATLEEQKRMRKTEENQNFMELRKRYNDLWMELIKDGRGHLDKGYKDKSELIKLLKTEERYEYVKSLIHQILFLLSDIEFMYNQKQDTAYWKRWNDTFNQIFSKKLFITAFFKYENRFADKSFVDYVHNVLKKHEIKVEKIPNK